MGDNFLLPSRGNHQPNVRALFENKRAMANRYNNTHFAKKKKKRKVSTKRKRGERIQVRPPTRSVAEGEQLSFIDSKTLEKTFDPHLDNDAKLWFDQHVLNLYAKMVSGGEWKDYGLSISKKEVSFNVYHRSSEFPAYKITKNLKPKNESEKYIIKNSQNKIINNSENLQNLIKKIIWKKFKLVN